MLIYKYLTMRLRVGRRGTLSVLGKQWFDLPGSMTRTLAINLTQPIFQKRALKTAYETAALDQEIAVIQFRQTFLVAVGEVSDAMARSANVSE